ncbi:MAG: hypothetical protein GX421_00255 [Caldisericales bacterium]|nr:hypothetical protein [Caldisericales bacterium]
MKKATTLIMLVLVMIMVGAIQFQRVTMRSHETKFWCDEDTVININWTVDAPLDTAEEGLFLIVYSEDEGLQYADYFNLLEMSEFVDDKGQGTFAVGGLQKARYTVMILDYMLPEHHFNADITVMPDAEEGVEGHAIKLDEIRHTGRQQHILKMKTILKTEKQE